MRSKSNQDVFNTVIKEYKDDTKFTEEAVEGRDSKWIDVYIMEFPFLIKLDKDQNT